MDEIWKPIKDYEDLYQASNLGKIKSLARKTGKGYKGVNHKYMVDRIRKQGVTIHGYNQVSLDGNGKPKNCSVHKLILIAFNPTDNKKLEVNHKNGVKTDNRLENLEWVTSKENKKHAFDTGLCNHRRGEGLYNSKFTNEQIIQIRKLHKENKHKQTEIAEMFNVTKGCICHIIHRRAWKHI